MSMSGYDYGFAGPFPLPVCGQCENMDCQNKQCGQGNPCQSCITSFPRWCNCFCTRCSNTKCVNGWCRDQTSGGKKCDHCKSLILKKGSCFCPTPPCFRCSNKDCINKAWCGRAEYGYQQCEWCIEKFSCKCAKIEAPAAFEQFAGGMTPKSFGGAEGFVCTNGCKNPTCTKKSCTGGCNFCQRNAPAGGWCKCAALAPVLAAQEGGNGCNCPNPVCRNRGSTCFPQNPCIFCVKGQDKWCKCTHACMECGSFEECSCGDTDCSCGKANCSCMSCVTCGETTNCHCGDEHEMFNPDEVLFLNEKEFSQEEFSLSDYLKQLRAIKIMQNTWRKYVLRRDAKKSA